jgi:hypothetical protein
LNPYFYVLNNLLRATIDPKIGDSTTIQHHAPTILVCFGLDKRFSLTNLIWRNIQEVSLDPHKSLPYAPYLIYIIEQVTGFSFAYDTNHPDWRIRYLGPHLGKGKSTAIEASGSGAIGASDDVGGGAAAHEDAPLLLLDVDMGVVMVVVQVVPPAMLSGGSSPTSATPRRRPMRAFVALRSMPIFLLHPLFMSF